MRKRINIMVSPDTLALLDRVAPKGTRGRLIDEAVKFFVEQRGQSNLKEQLAEGYRAHARHDLELAEEWFSIDEEAWQKGNV
jgi:CopG family transcriptional regulator / antitoxin EndoAI